MEVDFNPLNRTGLFDRAARAFTFGVPKRARTFSLFFFFLFGETGDDDDDAPLCIRATGI